jgi:hypothetical protein
LVTPQVDAITLRLSATELALFFVGRTGSSLFEWEYGDESVKASDWLHCRFDNPMLPPKKAALGQLGKAVGCVPTALLF